MSHTTKSIRLSAFSTLFCLSMACKNTETVHNTTESEIPKIELSSAKYYPEKVGSTFLYAGSTYYSKLDTTYPDTIKVARQTLDSCYCSFRILAYNKLTQDFDTYPTLEKFKIDNSHNYKHNSKTDEYSTETEIIFKPYDSLYYTFRWSDYDINGKSEFRIFRGKLLQ